MVTTILLGPNSVYMLDLLVGKMNRSEVLQRLDQARDVVVVVLVVRVGSLAAQLVLAARRGFLGQSSLVEVSNPSVAASNLWGGGYRGGAGLESAPDFEEEFEVFISDPEQGGAAATSDDATRVIAEAQTLLDALSDRPTAAMITQMTLDLRGTVSSHSTSGFAGWSDDDKSSLLLILANLWKNFRDHSVKPIPPALLKAPSGQFARVNWKQAKRILGMG